MEIVDFLLSLLGSLAVELINRVFPTKIKLGYGGEQVTGLFTLVLLIACLIVSIRAFTAIA
jgi:hypothetical protein